jgi:hypothetical protein
VTWIGILCFGGLGPSAVNGNMITLTDSDRKLTYIHFSLLFLNNRISTLLGPKCGQLKEHSPLFLTNKGEITNVEITARKSALLHFSFVLPLST